VVANFKETQIEDIKVGQTVNVEVDAYPGQKFEGKVESIQAGTGAKFSLLPPDNSSGNFVKVVQRVPVKIVIDNTQLKEFVLRPGMNCSIAVDTK
jgi:membrane fusion protein (multidrug efflux system)